jgi:hypothetical protein
MAICDFIPLTCEEYHHLTDCGSLVEPVSAAGTCKTGTIVPVGRNNCSGLQKIPCDSVSNTTLWPRELANGQGSDANGKKILITEVEILNMVAGTCIWRRERDYGEFASRVYFLETLTKLYGGQGPLRSQAIPGLPRQ